MFKKLSLKIYAWLPSSCPGIQKSHLSLSLSKVASSHHLSPSQRALRSEIVSFSYCFYNIPACLSPLGYKFLEGRVDLVLFCDFSN
jgi:hypothetical protein